MHNITIYLKNGNLVHLKMKSFTTTQLGGELTGLKWENLESFPYPYPLFLNMDDISAITCEDVKDAEV